MNDDTCIITVYHLYKAGYKHKVHYIIITACPEVFLVHGRKSTNDYNILYFILLRTTHIFYPFVVTFNVVENPRDGSVPVFCNLFILKFE